MFTYWHTCLRCHMAASPPEPSKLTYSKYCTYTDTSTKAEIKQWLSLHENTAWKGTVVSTLPSSIFPPTRCQCWSPTPNPQGDFHRVHSLWASKIGQNWMISNQETVTMRVERDPERKSMTSSMILTNNNKKTALDSATQIMSEFWLAECSAATQTCKLIHQRIKLNDCQVLATWFNHWLNL